MFMVLAKSADEMRHIENVVACICAAVVFIVCAFLFAYLIERRVSEWECRERIKAETRLQRSKNEIEREKQNYRLIDPELRSLVDYQKKVIAEKDQQIYELKKRNEEYKLQLDEVKLGTFNGRSLKHVEA